MLDLRKLASRGKSVRASEALLSSTQPLFFSPGTTTRSRWYCPIVQSHKFFLPM